jgi:hypothetical protein
MTTSQLQQVFAFCAILAGIGYENGYTYGSLGLVSVAVAALTVLLFRFFEEKC